MFPNGADDVIATGGTGAGSDAGAAGVSGRIMLNLQRRTTDQIVSPLADLGTGLPDQDGLSPTVGTKDIIAWIKRIDRD